MLSRIIAFLLFVSITTTANAQQRSDYEKANQAFNEGLIDQSYIHLKNSLDNTPNHLPSKILMGYVLGLSGYFEEAELELNEALSRGADANLIVEPLVNVLLALGKYQQIVELPERQLTPLKKALLLSTKGISYSNLGNNIAAVESFEKALKLVPQSVTSLNSYANFLINQQELTEAESLISQSLAIDDSWANTHFLQSTLYNAQGKREEEIAALRKTLEIAGSHPLALRELASALSNENRFEETKVVLQKTLALTPNDPIGQLLLSWVASNLNDDELTKKTLGVLVNNLRLIDPEELENNVELLFIDGMANFASNNLEAAKNSLNQYLYKRPNNMQAANILIDIYKAEGNFTGAIGILENYESQLDDDLPLAMELCELYILANLNHKCAWLLTLLEKNFNKESSYIEMSARLLAARGKLDLALGMLDEIESGTLNNVVQKAILSIRAERYTEANQHIDVLLKEYPDSPGLKNLRATVLARTNRAPEAEALYREILKDFPEHFESTFNLASKLFRERRAAEAIPFVESLYAKRPDSVEVLTLYGRILMLDGKTERALEILQNANSKAPENIEIKESLIDLQIRMGNNDKALSILNKLIKDDFLNSQYLYKRGLIYTNLNDVKMAKEDFKSLLGIYSNNATDLYRLSIAQSRISDAEGALKTLTRILEIEENNFFAKRDSVRLLLVLQRTQEAKDALSTLQKAYPKNPDVNMLLGDINKLENNFDAAAARYVDAIKSQNLLAPALIKSYQLAIEGHGEAFFIKQFESLARDYERNTFSANLLADYYLTTGNTSRAKTLYLSLSESIGYVGRPLVLNNLANLYIEEGKVDAAYNFAQQAYEVLPENQAILDTFGWTLALRGNYENALDLLRRSYSMNASDPGVRYHIAYTLMKLGRNDEAVKEVNVLLSDFGDFANRQKVEELKAELSKI